MVSSNPGAAGLLGCSSFLPPHLIGWHTIVRTLSPQSLALLYRRVETLSSKRFGSGVWGGSGGMRRSRICRGILVNSKYPGYLLRRVHAVRGACRHSQTNRSLATMTLRGFSAGREGWYGYIGRASAQWHAMRLTIACWILAPKSCLCPRRICTL